MSAPEQAPIIPPPGAALTRADYARLSGEIAAARIESVRWLRVAVLSSFTSDLLKPYLIVEGARRGLGIDLWLAPFGQIEQQALDPRSELHAQAAELVLILPRLEDLAPELSHRFVAHAAEALEAARKNLTGRLRAVVSAIRQNGKAKIVLGNFAPPLWLAADHADASLELSQSAFVHRLNEDVAAICREVPDAFLLDVARVAAETGLARWQDERMAYLAKAPLSADAMIALAATFARRVRPLFFTPKKCLVLDMDNTLWGGVLGEAGIDGIALGPDYPGNVFVDFQKRVLALRDRGILLAAASKNNAPDVEQVLAQHPSCLLKRDYFAAFEVHWEDKATSMRRIAAALNIGIDSLVFFDDNPVEREWVRAQTPEVTVIDVPASPLGYAKALAECGCFDLPTLTNEDRRRAELYQQETGRQQLQAQAGSLEDFLRGLEMTLTAGLADEATLPRIVQLLGKTNQFNLTTRRHSPAEIQAMIDQGGFVLWAKVRDKFGDAGLIGAAIALPYEGDAWMIDTFLMSCRVIGRGVETAMLALVEKLAHVRGARRLIGEFIPTAKNQPAADLLPRHGFDNDAVNPQRWILSLITPRAVPDYFALEGEVATA